MFSLFKRQQPSITAHTFFYHSNDNNKDRVFIYDGGDRTYAVCPTAGERCYVEIVVDQISHPKNKATVVEITYGERIVIHARIDPSNLEGYCLAEKHLVRK